MVPGSRCAHPKVGMFAGRRERREGFFDRVGERIDRLRCRMSQDAVTLRPRKGHAGLQPLGHVRESTKSATISGAVEMPSTKVAKILITVDLENAEVVELADTPS